MKTLLTFLIDTEIISLERKTNQITEVLRDSRLSRCT